MLLRTFPAGNSALVALVIQLTWYVAQSSGGEQKQSFTQKLKHRNNGLFDKIVRKEVPCDFLHEDDLCVAFDDINPQAPEHFLVLPKKKIVSLSLAADEDAKILGHLMIVAKKVAAKKLIRNYRVVVNNGWEAVQFSGHLHLHVLGGRPLHWPPG
ncbi:uncharacterized protein LOC103508380 isoform X3 [Diaphorina citri]|uniref:Uncharacterized protein LOC103508380 isoform X3 n=1 Tax=Diaphorina citri TaxID=121845 RepID=A0A3Q0ITV3_DIACI|nr:uncharacterized protein LOC103508380 isoform X3 [Diaphorina citri]KAI5749059.1 hypothetical protein M8J76_004371 [Diaphorina citri]KAI5756285.1 hypothetical protein M8J77_023756 [Diaphorina citri]